MVDSPVRVGTRIERKERTRRAILDAALALSDDSSLVALSLRQIAKEVGIVPTAFYRHFDSIDALGLELVDEAFASLRAMLRDVRRNAPGFGDIVDDSVAIVVQHVRVQRAHLQFIVRERGAGPRVVREEVRRQLGLVERELAADLAGLPGTRSWSERDLRLLSNLMVNAMVATAEGILAHGADLDIEREFVESARTQLRMILVGATHWRSQPG